MTTTPTAMPVSPSHDVIIAAAQRAARAIPPLWPLASSVAVNPFLGQGSEPLEMAGGGRGRASRIAVNMPRAWDAQRPQCGPISRKGLESRLPTPAAT
ncbi:Na-translocating system protein MpsB, partial [Xanthomonas perforans]|uniref:putative inorganic carbon transporter subunit DabA n=1 Tax=Xanthomonas perforans TaxID=442694 RepID=UPI001F3A379D